MHNASASARITNKAIERFLVDLQTLDIRILHTTCDEIQQLIHVSATAGLTPYDAAYLRLASETASPLATFDIQLATAAQMAGVPLMVRHFV